MTFAPFSMLVRSLALAGVALFIGACTNGGSEGGGTTPSAQTGVSISGTVSGTRIVAMDGNDQIIAEDDTAGRTPDAQGRIDWSLDNLPIGSDIRLFFITGGNVYPMYFGNPGSNVFAVNTVGVINLGHVTTSGTQATPEIPPAGVTPGPPNPAVPPAIAPVLTISSPADNATLPNGPVTVTFDVKNFTLGTVSQPHLHFYLDNDLVPYHFYSGAPGQILYQGAAAANAQWQSNGQILFPALAVGSHQVRLVLANLSDVELTDPEATKTLNFTVNQPPTGDLQLQPVLSNLNFPVGMALAPDGRVFFNERLTGKIRIVNPQWQLVPTEFCQISVATNGEQGLLGLTLDPAFAQNHFVYVYYTASGATKNRVVRYTESSGSCTNETPILDDLPVSANHNGGIIQFGPDGKLYVVIGDVQNTANSQSLTSLAGKILRVNPDGSAPGDNPFILNVNANAKNVFSLGHRNSYGFTFHSHTGHLWETENGPGDNDEINRVVAGGNYGWPTVGGIANNPSFLNPILAYTPTIAPTGIISIPENSSVYPVAYRNNLLFVDFNGGKIRRVVLSGADLTQLGTSSVAYNGGNGFLLSLMLGADGFVYVSNGSAIFKVVAP